MHVLIVYAHPEPASFNAAMRDVAASRLRAGGHDVVVSDLYASNFDPVAGAGDFFRREDAQFLDYLAEQRHANSHRSFALDIEIEQHRIRQADLVIFQFPIWWRSVPAILKGWFDRVLATGFAFGPGRTYANGPFQKKTALIAATAGGPLSPEEAQQWLGHVSDGVLAYAGFRVLPPFIAGGPRGGTDAERARLLDAYRERLLSIDDEFTSSLEAAGS